MMMLALAILVAPPVPVHAESAESLARQGNRLAAEGRPQEAVEAYREAIQKNPTSSRIKYNLGTTLAETKRWEEATRVLGEVTQTPGAPVRSDALYNLGWVLATQADPGDPQSPSPGSLQERIELLEQSLQTFRQAVLADPDDTQAKHNFEVIQERLNQLKQSSASQQPQSQRDESREERREDPSGDPSGQAQEEPSEASAKQSPHEEGERRPQPQQAEQPRPTPQPDPSTQPQVRPSESLEEPSGQPRQPSDAEKSDDEEDETTPDQPRLTPGQLDALRLLNMLQEARPENMDRLFQPGRVRERPPKKGW